MTTDDFLALFGLTASDLEENRRGRLSATQARLAHAATRGDAVGMGGFALGAWVVMGGVLWIFQTSPHAFRWGRGLSPSEVGILVLILALPIAATIWAAWTLVVHVRSRGAARWRCARGSCAGASFATGKPPCTRSRSVANRSTSRRAYSNASTTARDTASITSRARASS